MSSDFDTSFNTPIEKSNHLARKQSRRKASIQSMIICPYCHAMSYPRLYSDPKNDEEKSAIICGSCLANLRPFLEAMKKYEDKLHAEMGTGSIDNPIVINDAEDQETILPDSEKIVDSILTDREESSILYSDTSKVSEA